MVSEAPVGALPAPKARRALAALAIVVAFVCGGSRALAQHKGAETTPASDEARKAFEEGSRLYDAGRYDAAIERFQRAYTLSGLPGLLLSIAQAYRLKGPATCAQALSFYQRYLTKKPDSRYRREVLRRIHEMQACTKAAVAASPSPEQSAEHGEEPAPPRSSSSPAPPSEALDRRGADHARQSRSRAGEPWKTIGWVSAGVGAAGVVVGIVTGFLALRLQGELGGVCAANGACPRAEADRIHSYDALRTAALVGGIFGAAGGATAVFSFSRAGSGEVPNSSGGHRAQMFIGVRGRF